jgi:hypothetical protein
MKITGFGAFVVVFSLAACGGGGLRSSHTPVAVADTMMSAPRNVEPQIAALRSPAPKVLTRSALFDWAETAHPQLFAGSAVEGVSGPYSYRYYDQTGAYIGEADGAIYLLAPHTDGEIRYLGEIASFTCRVYPDTCVYTTIMSVDGTTPQFNASASFPAQSTPAQEVAQQAALPGDVILTMQPFRDARFLRLGEYLQAAKAYPSIKWVYLYDEMYWTGSRVAIGEHDAAISAAAAQVRSADLKTAVTLMPDVVLHEQFHFDAAAFDVVLLDPYPQAPTGLTNTCVFNENSQTTLLACAVQKLRAHGYAGEIWYVYQGFWLEESDVEDKLRRQRETIRDAPALGITGLVAFGLFPGAHMRPPLTPGIGSPYESLLVP